MTKDDVFSSLPAPAAFHIKPLATNVVAENRSRWVRVISVHKLKTNDTLHVPPDI